MQKNLWVAKKGTPICLKKLTKFFVFFPLSLSGLQAQELQSFCFKPSVSLNEARNYVREILLPQDQVSLREALHCLEIPLDQARAEMVEKYLSRRYAPVMRRNQIQEMAAARGECQMELKEIVNLERQKNEAGIGERTVLKRTQKHKEEITTSTMRLGVGLWGGIELDENRTELRCLKRAQGWQIEIRVASKRGYLHTTLDVVTGQEIDLGQTVQELNDKEREASTQSGVLHKQSIGQRTRRYLLTIR